MQVVRYVFRQKMKMKIKMRKKINRIVCSFIFLMPKLPHQQKMAAEQTCKLHLVKAFCVRSVQQYRPEEAGC